jgi:hypothetical protein
MVLAPCGLWSWQDERPGGVLVKGKPESEEDVWSMTGLAHSESESLVPDIFAWLEVPFVTPRLVAAQAMRMEEHAASSRYVIRAELPGVDPAKDMEVTVSKGILTVRAERTS